MHKGKQMNKKELKIELNKFENNAPALKTISSNREIYSIKKEKNCSYSKRNKHTNNNMPKKFIVLIIIIMIINLIW